jgi:hypothetical protein
MLYGLPVQMALLCNECDYEELDNEESICSVSLFVGVVGDKPIEEILNKESRQNRDIQ